MELDNLKLAEDSDAFLISSRQENHDVLLAMLTQAQQSLDIFSQNLDGPLYDTSEFLSALKQLSLDGRKPYIRILLKDVDYIVKNGHRIIELARRMSSVIEIRKVNSDFDHIISCYSIVDNRGIIVRNDATRYEAKVSFNDPSLARELVEQFNRIWDKSSPSQEMHSLHI